MNCLSCGDEIDKDTLVYSICDDCIENFVNVISYKISDILEES